MSEPIDYPSWGEAKQIYLRRRGEHLLGPARTPTDDHDEIGFRVTYLPNGETIVTLTETCGLNTVHDLCQLITDACLNGNEDIDFTRDPTEADTRLSTFDQ
jgi:hypothetical protein